MHVRLTHFCPTKRLGGRSTGSAYIFNNNVYFGWFLLSKRSATTTLKGAISLQLFRITVIPHFQPPLPGRVRVTRPVF